MGAKLTSTHEQGRTDQRMVAEATLETGVTLSESSDWNPSHWDQEPLRREVEARLRRRFKQAQLMGVGIGPIRVYRETRVTVTHVDTHVRSVLYAEVTP